MIAIDLPHLPNPAAWFAHPPSAQPTVHRRRVGPWRLEIVHDPFTGKTQCRLHTWDMSYGPAAMTFRFDAHADTFGAMYKIDDGPATSWRVNAMTLASQGVRLQTDSLTNASGGRVFVPIEALAGAHTVMIRPSTQSPARIFKLDGLAAALDIAQKAGCPAVFSATPNE